MKDKMSGTAVDTELFIIAYNKKINRVYYHAHSAKKVLLGKEFAKTLGFITNSLTGRNC